MTRTTRPVGRALRGKLATLALLLVAAVFVAPGPAGVAAPSSPSVLAAGTSNAAASVYSLGVRSFSAGHLYVAFMSLSETGDHVDSTPGIVGAGTSWTAIDKGEASASVIGM